MSQIQDPHLTLNPSRKIDEIKHDNTHLDLQQTTVQLREGQTFLLSRPSNKLLFAGLSFAKGFTRLSGSFGQNFSDITLAFSGNYENRWFRLLDDSNILLEAMTDTIFVVNYFHQSPEENDLIRSWLLDLHLVRHPVRTEERLISLFQLLVSRFGKRIDDKYLLPFSLGHSRMAEIIGATRSTVTRQITLLRQQNDLSLGEEHQGLLFSINLIENL